MCKYTTVGRVAALFCFAVALSSSAVASGGAAGAPTDGLRLHPMCELDARAIVVGAPWPPRSIAHID